MTYRTLSVALFTLAIVLSACGGGQPADSAAAQARSRTLQPSDPQLAAIYQRSCRSCHTVAATGAPLTGDRAAWQPRMERGMQAMVDSAVNGMGGMPPMGMCMDCDVEDFTALIAFMAAEQ